MPFKDLNVVVRHVATLLLVPVRRPVKLGEVDLEMAKFLRCCVDNLDSSGDDLWANAVGTDLSDFIDALTRGWRKDGKWKCTYRKWIFRNSRGAAYPSGNWDWAAEIRDPLLLAVVESASAMGDMVESVTVLAGWCE
jgi:hypothetical protein